MNTLALRTRVPQNMPSSSSSSSRSSYYNSVPLRTPAPAARPVFISSPAPKRQPARSRRAA